MSLDHADADLYGALLNRPATGTPVNLPVLPDLGGIETKAQEQARLAREYQDYVKRGEQLVREQNEYQKLREQEYQRSRGIDKPSPQPTQQIPQNEPPQSGLSPLQQMQRSTPERIPQPSTGSPPPTPNNTTARASPLVEPTATPAPAALKEALPLAALPIQKALPRTLPQAAGRLAVPGVAAGIDLAGRLMAGQPIQQAATGAAAGAIGGGIGALVGNAIVPGLGGVVGYMIGGFIGGRISDAFFQQLPTTDSRLAEPYINYPAFQGGQAEGGLYRVQATWSTTHNGQPSGDVVMDQQVYGAIEAIRIANYPGVGSPGVDVIAKNANGGSEVYHQGSGFYPATVPYNLRGVKITYLGGAPENPVDQQILTPPPDNRPPYYNEPPLNYDATIPSGVPSNGTKGKNTPIAPSKPSGGNPRGEGNDWVPSGHLAPGFFPSPDRAPSNLGGLLPQLSPIFQPLPFAEPEDMPVRRFGVTSTPSTGGIVEPVPVTSIPSEGTDAFGNYHDGKGGYFTPDGKPIPRTDLGSPQNSTPPSLASGSPPQPVPDAVSPIPKANTAPIPKTEQEAANDDFLKKFNDILGQINAIGTAITGVGLAVGGIPNAIANNPNVRAANRDDVQGAVCEIAAPGGCLGSRHDQTQQQNAANGNKLDAINAALNAGNLGANAQLLAGQATILERLGPQLPGGLSGKLERLAKWLHLDRVLNILIWWQTLHNAYMLSANLGQTLTSAISNVLAAIGIKDAEGSALDIGQILGGQFDNLAKTVIGESEWGGIKAEYKKWNRIYQAAANLMYSIQSIGASILNALEVVGSWVALIGNALRKWGEVSERAYRWMNPQIDFQNKYFTALENAENVVSQIDVVASEVLSIQDTVKQIKDQKTEMDNALKQVDNSKQKDIPSEAEKLKQQETESKAASTAPELSETDKEPDED